MEAKGTLGCLGIGNALEGRDAQGLATLHPTFSGLRLEGSGSQSDASRKTGSRILAWCLAAHRLDSTWPSYPMERAEKKKNALSTNEIPARLDTRIGNVVSDLNLTQPQRKHKADPVIAHFLVVAHRFCQYRVTGQIGSDR